MQRVSGFTNQSSNNPTFLQGSLTYLFVTHDSALRNRKSFLLFCVSDGDDTKYSKAVLCCHLVVRSLQHEQ